MSAANYMLGGNFKSLYVTETNGKRRPDETPGSNVDFLLSHYVPSPNFAPRVSLFEEVAIFPKNYKQENNYFGVAMCFNSPCTAFCFSLPRLLLNRNEH